MKLVPDRRTFNDQELKKALQPILRQLRRQHYFMALLRGITLAMGVSLLLLVCALLRPWVEVAIYCLTLAGIILVLSMLSAIILRPGLWEAACQTDTRGLQERVSTALELSCQSPASGLKSMQREDALKHLRALDVGASFPLSFPRREGRVLAALALFLVLINIIPNPQQGEVKRQAAIRREIAQQEKLVEKVKKDLEKKNEKAPSTRREEGIKALEDLQKKLNSTQKQDEAMKSLTSTEEKLQKLVPGGQENVNSDLERLSQALKQEEISRELGEKLDTGDSRAVEQSFARMAARVPSMSTGDKQNMAAGLSQAATSVGDAGLQSQLNQAARALNSGSAQAAGSQLGALGAMLGQMSEQAAVNADLARAQIALQSARTGIAAAGSSPGGSMASTGAGYQHPECNAPGGNGT